MSTGSERIPSAFDGLVEFKLSFVRWSVGGVVRACSARDCVPGLSCRSGSREVVGVERAKAPESRRAIIPRGLRTSAIARYSARIHATQGGLNA